MSKQVDIATLKAKYVEYYTDVPVQKYAAMSVGRDEDTIIRWKKEDSSFADRVDQAKAQFVRKRMLAVKSEYALERLMNDVFSGQPQPQRVNVEFDQPEANNLAREFTEFMLEKTKSGEIE